MNEAMRIDRRAFLGFAASGAAGLLLPAVVRPKPKVFDMSRGLTRVECAIFSPVHTTEFVIDLWDYRFVLGFDPAEVVAVGSLQLTAGSSPGSVVGASIELLRRDGSRTRAPMRTVRGAGRVAITCGGPV